MDPQHRGPEEQDVPGAARSRDGHDLTVPRDTAGSGLVPRPAAPAVVVPPYGTAVPRNASVEQANQTATARRTEVVAGAHLLTVNPADGSEVVPAPAERIPALRRRGGPDRAARSRAARPGPIAGSAASRLPLLERDEECERLVGLLARGRSVRVTGPAGSGRTALLAEVADRCVDLAPDGVIRLSGHRRSPLDLMHDLYAVVYDTDGHRPARARLLEGVRGIGAVVVLDDVEFGGKALEELLGAASECAFLISATPHVPSPLGASRIEEVFLGGLSRAGCATLLMRSVGREPTREETAWAESLWSASEGLPLRVVQAAAVLRQRAGGDGAGHPADTLSLTLVRPGGTGPDRPSPALTPGATPADLLDLLVAGLSRNAREALRVAAALGGECVDPTHLPALVAAEQADTALTELAACGLITPVAAHYRLAPGVRADCRVRSAGSDNAGYALTAARHYVWWAGHPSVPAGRVAAESAAILAAMSACRDNGHHQAALRLARTAAPVFAAALNWGAWERALRIGLEAARLAGEVGEEAYFHHELGVLALCEGNPERARTELEASIGMRGVMGDRQGSLAGRRILALVGTGADRSGRSGALVPAKASAPPTVPGRALATRPAAQQAAPAVRRPAHALPPGASPTVVTPSSGRSGSSRRSQHRRRPAVIGSRRNLAAAGAGAVIAAVLGTVVTLGTASDNTPAGPANAKSGGAAAQNDRTGMPADQPTEASSTSRPPSTPRSASASASATSGGTGATVAPVPAGPTPSAGGGTHHTSKPKPTPSRSHPSGSGSPSAPASPSQSPTPTPTPTATAPTGTTSAPAPTGSATPTRSPTPTGSASQPAPSGSATATP